MEYETLISLIKQFTIDNNIKMVDADVISLVSDLLAIFQRDMVEHYDADLFRDSCYNRCKSYLMGKCKPRPQDMAQKLIRYISQAIDIGDVDDDFMYVLGI